MAPTLPTRMVVIASTKSAGAHLEWLAMNASSKMRSAIANAAALVATAMNVVIGVGAPWYTSGVHWWNGATDALKASPTAVRAMPVRRRGSASETVWPMAAAMRPRSVDPVEPYTSASPYSSVADPIEPMIRYLSPASSDFSWRTRLAQST